MNKALISTVFVAMVAAMANVSAAPISGVTVTTTFPNPGDEGSLIAHITDGSGLSSYTTGATHDSGSPTNAWVVTGRQVGTITFNLGSTFLLDGMAVWNLNALATRGVKSLTVESSIDGIVFTPIVGAPTTFAEGAAFATEAAQLFSFTQLAEFVRFDVTSGFDGVGIGLSEIMFTGRAAGVPEPGSLALLGLGMIGLVAARRKRNAA